MMNENDMMATNISHSDTLTDPRDFSNALVTRMLDKKMQEETSVSGESRCSSTSFANKAKVVKAISTFLSKINDYLMKCAEIGRVSGLAHIVYGKYSRYTMLSGTPALYVGSSIASAFSPDISPMKAADIIFDIVSAYYENASIPLRAERYSSPGRWIGFYSLDRKSSSVQGAIEMHIELLEAQGFSELVDRDVFESDIDAWLAGVPLSDIFA